MIDTALLFDRSEATRLVMTGADRKDLLHRLSTNDIRSLKRGQGTAALLLERSGRLLDRLIVADRGEDLLLLGNVGRAGVLREWIEKFTILEDSHVQDVGALTGERWIAGPGARDLIGRAFGEAALALGVYDNAVLGEGERATTIVRVEDHGGPAYAVIFAKEIAEEILGSIAPAASGTSEMLLKLRVEAGVPSWGSELDERTIPLEARLVDAISFTKGCYVGQEVIARVHHHKRVKRLLCRLEIEGEEEPAPGSEVLYEERKVGRITASSARSDRCIALGYVESGLDAPGTILAVLDGAERRTAHVLTLNPEGDPRWPA